MLLRIVFYAPIIALGGIIKTTSADNSMLWIIVIAVAALMNATSKARSKGNERAIDILAQQALIERQSRENWQNVHAPTTTQYVDIRTSSGAVAGAGASSSALAQAEAALLSGALTGQYARCPQEVTLVSKRSCPCPASDCGC